MTRRKGLQIVVESVKSRGFSISLNLGSGSFLFSACLSHFGWQDSFEYGVSGVGCGTGNGKKIP